MTEKTPIESAEEYIHALKVWRVLGQAVEDLEKSITLEGLQGDKGLQDTLSNLRTGRDDQKGIVDKAFQAVKGISMADLYPEPGVVSGTITADKIYVQPKLTYSIPEDTPKLDPMPFMCSTPDDREHVKHRNTRWNHKGIGMKFAPRPEYVQDEKLYPHWEGEKP